MNSPQDIVQLQGTAGETGWEHRSGPVSLWANPKVGASVMLISAG